ncbi:Transcriptional termination factor [Lactobacillus gigeriorum DSM 23908 = CRBIP 24.85]|uniref:Transcriptional termination factor n=2 Tax=Lactobacillus gigeriorum DSM 23908 = CRBIP 24.85 TaxID=1423751 RepID=I7LC39_9LACO|nr:Transcriptional termination factor [Lactobacillus gigeriorum DSM 23908 = CRBIP 24.85]
MRMNQHDSRRIAMQAIFSANQAKELSASEVEAKTMSVLNLKELSAYSQALIAGIIEHRDELEADITDHLKAGWRLSRINAIVVAILEVALYEIKYREEIQPKAAVNEALNLCDEFADPKAKPFVNGILANFVNE